MNVKTTKKALGGRRARSADMAPEYRFDYRRAQRNRFAGRSTGEVVIVLDPDVAEVYRDSAQVNALLRAAIASVAKPRRRKTARVP